MKKRWNPKSFAWFVLILTIALIIVPLAWGFISMLSICSIYIKMVIVGVYILVILFWLFFITSFERVDK